ncbi:MAG: polysaccharide biosynthesis protein, partial [Acidimicrobiia bacterium]|nr:polysaccharide biosynthesis protein [Acidimicrobiia bacterium]
ARASDHDTTVSIVRYGNVLYSRGSVVPLFVEQILADRSVTVTDPEMTRFLLPLQQAVELVMFALLEAEPGDIFIRKAGAATIGDIASATGAALGRNVAMETIGVRHGEKVYETLATSEELAHSEDLGDYFRLRMDTRTLNYSAYFDEGESRSTEDFHSHNAKRMTVSEITDMLLSLPEIQRIVDAA